MAALSMEISRVPICPSAMRSALYQYSCLYMRSAELSMSTFQGAVLTGGGVYLLYPALSYADFAACHAQAFHCQS